MIKNLSSKVAAAASVLLMLAGAGKADACSNVIISKGASADGSCMIAYAADAHNLFGELYYHPAQDWKPGSMLQIIEWDTLKPLGEIAQASHTYQTVGNMNEHQLIIAETTFGGRSALYDSTATIDYGSLIYITLQRAKTAREAIRTIIALTDEYGYASEGESFSIADKDEAWVMDLIGRGPGKKGIVYVARRVPDGFICAHANQSRIGRFPHNDPDNCLYAPDVIDLAREHGWYSGSDEDFSFCDAYCPASFGTNRGCDARAWSAFNILTDGQFTYIDADGKEVTAPASDWLDYAMGYNLTNRMPLFVKPSRKITVKNVADVMRDHYEGTPMDMTQDIGAGGNALPYRWRPMSFIYNGHEYMNERAIATQQTGFWFVAQSRGYLPDEIGSLIWFGTDDAATSYISPIYVCTKEIPECYRVGNGDLLHYSATSSFWMNNRVTNDCYRMYNHMAPYVRHKIDAFENYQMTQGVAAADKEALKLYNNGKGAAKACDYLTRYSVETAQNQFNAWAQLEEHLMVKFMDGNLKPEDADGNFIHSKYNETVPAEVEHPEYTDKWKESVAREHGSVIMVPEHENQSQYE